MRIPPAKLSAATSYSLSTDNKTLTITGTGAMTNYTSSNYTDRPWNSYATTITKIVISSGVTAIGDYAFQGMTAVESVTYSPTVTITTIGVGSFYGCSSLKTISIPTTVTTIGKNAYRNCSYSGITSITIPENIIAIGDMAFYGTKITTVKWNARRCNGTTATTEYTSSTNPFWGILPQITSFTFGNNVEIIPAFLCYKMSSVEVIKVPAVFSIGKFAFSLCTSLKEFYVSPAATVNSYPESMLSGCTSLQKVTISKNINSLGEKCLSNCSALEYIYALTQTAPSVGTDGLLNVPTSTTKLQTLNSTAASSYGSKSPWSNFSNRVWISSYTINYDEKHTLTMLSRDDVHDTLYVSTQVKSGVTLSESVSLPPQFTSSNGLYYGYIVKPISIVNSGYSGQTNIKTLLIGNSYDTIGNSAFNGCSALNDVTIGNNVVSIGSSAFSGCNTITTVKWNAINCDDFTSSTTPFSASKSEMTSFVLSNSIIHIPAYICYQMSKISNTYSFSNSLVSIGNSAFLGCTSIKGINFNSASSLVSIGTNAFYNCNSITSSITLPASLTLIDQWAFQKCEKLSGVKFADGIRITSISNYCFDGCISLSGEIEIPSSVTSIGNYAFRNCSTVVSLNLMKADALTTIGNYAFSGMSAVEGLMYIPSTVTSIGTYALQNMTSIEGIVAMPTSPPTVTNANTFNYIDKSIPVYVKNEETANKYKADTCIGWKDFYNYKYETEPQQCGDNLYWQFRFGTNRVVFTGSGDMWNYNNSTNKAPWRKYSDRLYYVDFCNDMTSIGDYAFYQCTNFIPNTFNIKANIRSIGQYAFYQCVGIKNLGFADNSNLTSIGQRAFQGCTGLMSVNLPEGLETIPTYCFYSCSNITEILFPSILTTIGNSAFQNCSSLKYINLPASVTTLEGWAFANCSEVEYIKSDNPIPPSALASSFNNISKTTTLLCVQEGSNDDYCAATGWSAFCDNVGQDIGGSCGNDVYWRLNFKTKELTIYGNGAMSEFGLTSMPWYRYIDDIKKVVIEEGVTTIGKYSFYKHIMESVEIPSTIIKISESAFSSCSELDTLWVGFNLSSTVSLPQTMNGYSSYINKQFENVPTDVVIAVPAGSESTFQSASVWCNFTNYHVWGYCGADADEKNVKWILGLSSGLMQFIGERDIKTYSTYSSVPWYSNYRTIITSAIFSEGITVIGNRVLYSCSALTSVSLPSTLVTIGSYAFNNCTQLAEITLPAGINNLYTSAFQGCSGITRTNFNGTVAQWCNIYISNADANPLNIGNSTLYIGGEQVVNLIIPDEITEIKNYSFTNCKGLKSVNMSNVATIGNYAFYKCLQLESVTFSNNLSTIGTSAFYGCNNSNFVTIHLPQSLTSIGTSAFSDCTKLSTIYSYKDTPPTIATNTFTNIFTPVTSCKIYVPCSQSITDYKANSNWNSKFSSASWYTIYDTCDDELIIEEDKSMSDAVTKGFRGDIIVKEGVTFTMNNAKKNFDINSIILEPTSHVSLLSNATYSINNLIVQRRGDETNDEVATADLQGSLTAQNLILDFTLDNSRWFAFSLPQSVAASSVTYSDGTALRPDVDYYAMYFDGESRAINGYSASGDNWRWLTGGDIVAHRGYLLGLPDGVSEKTLRFTMQNPNLTQTEDKNIAVSEYASQVASNAGWNMIGNPYLQPYQNSETQMQIGDEDLMSVMTFAVSGEHLSYTSELVNDVEWQPFSAMFIQAPATGSLVFDHSSARRSIVSRRQGEKTPTNSLRLELANTQAKDRMTFIMGDFENSEYRIGVDMAKWFNDSYKTQPAPTLYSMKGNINMTMHALGKDELHDIPIGIFAPRADDYLFSISHDDRFSKVLLYDALADVVTDLKTTAYPFYLYAGTCSDRFFISATLKDDEQDTTTYTENTEQKVKIITEGLSIRLLNLPQTTITIFDTTGKQVTKQFVTTDTKVMLPQSGMYLVSYEDNGNPQTLRCIVK